MKDLPLALIIQQKLGHGCGWCLIPYIITLIYFKIYNKVANLNLLSFFINNTKYFVINNMLILFNFNHINLGRLLQLGQFLLQLFLILFISYIAKALSLGLRLIANMINNYALLKIFNKIFNYLLCNLRILGLFFILSGILFINFESSNLIEDLTIENFYNSIVLSIIPIKIYENADTQKKEAIEENRKKSGVYRWFNKINGKSYIGSSINLTSRFLDYYNTKQLLVGAERNMLIAAALLKHGYSNFRLEILEFCEPKNVIEREQYYLDLLNPSYNILRVAGSTLGFKHSKETKAKITAILESNHPRAISVEVFDTETNITTIYPSIRKVSEALDTQISTIEYHEKNFINKGIERLFKKRYKLEIKRNYHTINTPLCQAPLLYRVL